MKASELKSGNLVNQGEQYGCDAVDAYQIYNYGLMLGGNTDIAFYYKEWRPIKLTEQWALDLGFTKDDHTYTINRVTIDLTENSFFGNHFHYNGTVINYVHELQNLCYVLNKEELILRSK